MAVASPALPLHAVLSTMHKKGAADCCSIRGALLCRGGGHQAEASAVEHAPVHLLDWTSAPVYGELHSTVSAVLLSGSDAARRRT
eukprot:4806213-Lingulodinium_polyedra.AAC.1